VIGRRSLIQGGIALAGASLAWSADKKKDDDVRLPPPAPLATKTIPSTGERIAAVGVGTNNYSPQSPDERAARRAVLAGLTNAGASIIDTAPSYRDSEATIGELLAELGNRKQAFIATKVTAPDGDLAKGVAMIEESRRRLKTSVLDLVQIHNLAGVDVLFPYLFGLKSKGQVRYVGITTSNGSQHEQLVSVMKAQPVDFIEVDFSLGNRAAADEVLPAALDKRVGVLVNMPFGGRNGNTNLFSFVRDQQLPDWAGEIGARSWGQLFLKYVISHPAVTAAIPGTTRVEHLDDNLQAARGRLPDASMRARIEKWWDQNAG
jgi:aryl-alcohol dehydrogenase-like predicted oxidoreductase